MVDYISREAVVKYFEYCSGGYDYIETETKGAIDDIKAIPAADVREVVLCKDCRHRDPEDHKCDCGQLERAGCVFSVDDDYYCAYGEKREES